MGWRPGLVQGVVLLGMTGMKLDAGYARLPRFQRWWLRRWWSLGMDHHEPWRGQLRRRLASHRRGFDLQLIRHEEEASQPQRGRFRLRGRLQLTDLPNGQLPLRAHQWRSSG